MTTLNEEKYCEAQAAHVHNPLTTPGQMGVVADSAFNQDNDFWKMHIGLKVALLNVAPDGKYDVLIIDHGPCFGVSCERFYLYEEPFFPPYIPWYARLPWLMGCGILFMYDVAVYCLHRGNRRG